MYTAVIEIKDKTIAMNSVTDVFMQILCCVQMYMKNLNLYHKLSNRFI